MNFVVFIEVVNDIEYYMHSIEYVLLFHFFSFMYEKLIKFAAAKKVSHEFTS